MSESTTQALQLPESRPSVWAEAGRDLLRGILVTGQFFVTLAGCIALVGGAVLVTKPEAREQLLALLPSPTEIFGGSVAEAHAVVEAPAAEPAEKPKVANAAAEARQQHITRYLSRRYKVADEAVQRVVAEAFEIGTQIGLDPLLILAVTAIESSMNPFAQSSVGAQGLMQVMTSVHAEKFEPHGGGHAALDPIANVRVGSAILHDLIRRGGSVERGLQLYVGAGNLPDDGGYGARVLTERSHIALAASGKVDAAIATAWRQQIERATGAAPQRAPAPTPTGSGAASGSTQQSAAPRSGNST
jgi:hypothetical protein